jgi:hypothetical protein
MCVRVWIVLGTVMAFAGIPGAAAQQVIIIYLEPEWNRSPPMRARNSQPAISRRRVIGATLAATGVGLAACACAATSTTQRREPVRFDDPVWNREANARLEADTNGSQVFGRCSGIVCGVRAAEAVRPLYRFEVFSTIRVLRQSDGSYQRMTKETILYTDPKTGAMLDEWDNPYTGERVKVVDVANDPYNWIIASTVQPPAMPGIVTTGQAVPGGKPYLLDWTNFDDDTIIMTRDGHVYYPNRLDPETWPRESAGKMIQASELFRYFIKRSDLEDPNKTHVPTNGSWVRIQPWLPWMLMGQAPGHVLYDGVFRTYRDTKYFPEPVLERIRSRYPQYLTAPTTWYGPNYSSLEHYAREQKPAPVTAPAAPAPSAPVP